MGHFLQNSPKSDSRSSSRSSLLRSSSSRNSSSSPGRSSPSRAAAGTNMSSSSTTPQNLSAEAVAALPPPGMSGPSSIVFSPQPPLVFSNEATTATRKNKRDTGARYLAFLSSATQRTASARSRRYHQRNGAKKSSSRSGERQLCVVDLDQIQPGENNVSTRPHIFPLLRLPSKTSGRENSKNSSSSSQQQDTVSLEERLRRERQRLHASGGVTQFSWCLVEPDKTNENVITRILVPLRGNVYVQDGIGQEDDDAMSTTPKHLERLHLVYDKNTLQESLFHSSKSKSSGSVVGRDASAIDPQLSPDGTMVAFVVAGDIYVTAASTPNTTNEQQHNNNKEEEPPLLRPPVRITFGASASSTDDTSNSSDPNHHHSSNCCISHGLADFVAQEEMDRYRGYWWDPQSQGILFTRVDESNVPPYRITHQGRDGIDEAHEDHRYPFAGENNPKVRLGYVTVDRDTILQQQQQNETKQPQEQQQEQPDVQAMNVEDDNSNTDTDDAKVLKYFLDDDIMDEDPMEMEQSSIHESLVDKVALENFAQVKWLDPPREAYEYLARVSWLPDGSACAQWQNRTQSTLVLVRIDLEAKRIRTLLTERSDVWINLHHMMRVLPRPVHPDECYPTIEKHNLPSPLPPGSFSFLFASERTGYSHLYLYTYAPGYNEERAVLIRTVSSGDWMVEGIVGVNMEKDTVYITGTYDSPLERHLYALPIINQARQGEDSAEDGISSEVADGGTGTAPFDGIKGDATDSSGGVRRGLKQVMSALSGSKSSPFRRSNSSNMSTEMASVGDGALVPIRLTCEPGMHNIVMDDDCRMFVDTSSDLGRPTSVKVYLIPEAAATVASSNKSAPSSPARKKASRKQFDSADGCNNGQNSTFEQRPPDVRLFFVLYDAAQEDKAMQSTTTSYTTETSPGPERLLNNLPAPELLSFPTSDGTETLHAALYRPDPRVHGPGPYPLVCAVYGGPHVQRVNRSWSQCADMRAQRLRSLGFAVVKCDNRGSSRRGLAFESAIRRRLGRLEVLDQVTAVRQLTMRGIADPNRVGIYGWSYGGYLSAMCLCRAPDVFHVAVSGAPVTSWDGYDTHYTERYMGLPSENPGGYRESAVLDHVPNMRGKLMIVHGLIDENVHFRHTARLINRLIAAGKEYDLLIFPDERHSPRRLRDRIYMEQRISDYFLRNLGTAEEAGGGGSPATPGTSPAAFTRGGGDTSASPSSYAMRTMAGHL